MIVDFVKAYTTPSFPLYAEPVVEAVHQTVDLLNVAREKAIPVIFTQVFYNANGKDGGIFVKKVPILRKFVEGEPMTEIVRELAPVSSDIILKKQYASAFFGTNLASTLTALGVDTVILTGCSTSGCIRASAVDALQHGFRLIVPRECVGDRVQSVHDANLFDINAKYGDVLSKDKVLSYLKGLTPFASLPPTKRQRIEEPALALHIATPPATEKKRRDQLGWRKKFGVIIPSTNTIVEADFYNMIGKQLAGVTFHFGLMHIRSGNLSDDNHALKLLDQIRAEIDGTCAQIITAEPDWMICGMSGETFVGGKEGNAKFHGRIVKASGGLGVTSGADACAKAFQCFGAKRIAVITPYQPVFDKEVKFYFESMGYEVLNIIGLKCPSAVAIAEVTETELRAACFESAKYKPDLIVQCGTNLSMVTVAEEAEKWLGLPVIAINAAILWRALRDNGINEKLYGCTRLLREF